MTTATLLEGNCLDQLRTMPDDSVHAIVTDPPYGLANTDPAHVVDPFAGSGTTLEAAHLEGFNSIGIEMTDTYWPLIRHRIQRAEQAASAKTSADDEALFSWGETA